MASVLHNRRRRAILGEVGQNGQQGIDPPGRGSDHHQLVIHRTRSLTRSQTALDRGLFGQTACNRQHLPDRTHQRRLGHGQVQHRFGQHPPRRARHHQQTLPMLARARIDKNPAGPQRIEQRFQRAEFIKAAEFFRHDHHIRRAGFGQRERFGHIGSHGDHLQLRQIRHQFGNPHPVHRRG